MDGSSSMICRRATSMRPRAARNQQRRTSKSTGGCHNENFLMPRASSLYIKETPPVIASTKKTADTTVGSAAEREAAALL